MTESPNTALRIHLLAKLSSTLVRLRGRLGCLSWCKTKNKTQGQLASTVYLAGYPTSTRKYQLLINAFEDSTTRNLRVISTREMPCIRRWYERYRRIQDTWKISSCQTYTIRYFRRLMEVLKMVPYWIAAEEVGRVAKIPQLALFRKFGDLVVAIPELYLFSGASNSKLSLSEMEITEDCLALKLPRVAEAIKLQSHKTISFLLLLKHRLAERNLEVNDVQIPKCLRDALPAADELLQREFSQISGLIAIVTPAGRRPKLKLSRVVHRRLFTNYTWPQSATKGKSNRLKIARNKFLASSQAAKQIEWWDVVAEEESIIGLDKASNLHRKWYKDQLERGHYYKLESHIHKSTPSNKMPLSTKENLDVNFSYHADVRFNNESNPTNSNSLTLLPIRQVRQFHTQEPPIMVGSGTHDFVTRPSRSCFKPGTSVGWQFANLLYPVKKRETCSSRVVTASSQGSRYSAQQNEFSEWL